MFDKQRFDERAANIKTNMRNLVKTECVTPDMLLASDQMLDKCVSPALLAYDEELGALFRQYADAVAKAHPAT